MNGLLHHLLLTLRLNFRSRQALVYGYVVPVFFLIAFGSVFRSGSPPLVREMGQLLTISTLGGVCFGMPTAMVGERERGVWRRYRLLPSGGGAIVVSTMAARLLIVASAAVLQIFLARGIYGTPFPEHPWELAVAFAFVAFAFLGMGLVIAMLADTVPAVQALGQAVFLPMIMIGGVGLPLRSLPAWAQTVAGYLPGRYAVEALQACVNGPHGLAGEGFSLAAMAVIGAAGCAAGANLFRWDAGQRVAAAKRAWAALALASWAGVGMAAQATGKLTAVNEPARVVGRRQALGPSSAAIPATEPASRPATRPGPSDYRAVSDAELQAITYDDLADDSSPVTPLVASLEELSDETKQWVAAFRVRLADWPPGKEADLVQRTRNLLSVAAVADVAEFQYEGEIPLVVFEKLKAEIPTPELEKVLGYIILRPDDGSVLTSAPELGVPGQEDEPMVRIRSTMYAKKLLGRLLGKLGAGQG